MFKVKHVIISKGKFSTNLYGEDYFGDKRVFWEAHQSALRELCRKVCIHGYPFTIHDQEFDKITEIHSKEAFDLWLSEHQAFTCKCHSKP